MERTVLHCDLNSFYASVELLERPELRGRCVAVGGDEKSRHGIILAKNENAKRNGVVTGETLHSARKKCPELVVLPPNFEKYIYYSKKVRRIYCRYTDLVESFGADECWCDVSGSRFLFGNGEEIARKISNDVKAETGLTISVGVSFNKTMAKLGSDMKKPDAITQIRREDLPTLVWGLPCEELFGIGRATAAKLRSCGIYTIGDVAKMSESTARSLLGKNGITVRNYARGEDDTPVYHCEYVPDVKSISHGCTSAFDIYDMPTAKLLVMSLCEDIGESLRKSGLVSHCIQVHITDDLLAHKSFQRKTETALSTDYQLAGEAEALILSNYSFSRPIRAISVSATNLVSESQPDQLDIYTDYGKLERKLKVETVTDAIRGKMGKGAIVKASLMHTDFTRNCAIYDYNPFGHNAVR